MALNITIDARKFPSFEAAVKRFRKRVEKTGVLEEYLAHQYYTKPSDRRRRAREARRRQQRSGGKHAR